GPTFLALVSGGAAFFSVGGFLNILKVVKAVRIARILRLLRILKIFKQIKYADSPMAQRHVAKIISVGISVFVFTLLVYTIFTGIVGLPSAEQAYTDSHQTAMEMITQSIKTGGQSAVQTQAASNKVLLIVKRDGKTLYSKYDNDFYVREFGPTDYKYYGDNGFEFFFDFREFQQLQAKDNIMFFIVVIVLVLVLLVYYSPHFAITVSDPINVMRKGFEDNTYNLEVKIPERYKEDDVFVMAARYNEFYLPLKDRNTSEKGAVVSGLRMDDFQELFQEEQ
ncbi:MAG: ion transporter, partial [Spirochaetota bacterium]